MATSDALVFSAGFVVNKPDPAHFTFRVIKNILQKIMLDTEADDYKIYLGSSDKSNFRYKVDIEYKANRKDSKRPEYEKEIREYLFEHHKAIEVLGMETDDALGIEQCCLDDTIICSNDKDLDMIPGWHYDLDFGKTRRRKDGTSYRLKAYKNKALYFITDPGFLSLRTNTENGKKVLCGGGYLWFCAQLLLGDSVDNVKKLNKGYGPDKVYGILKDCKTEKEALQQVWKEYCHVFSTKNLTVDEARAKLMEVAQLLWIRRKKKDDVIFNRSWLC